MRRPPNHTVTRLSLAPTAAAPPVWFDDPAGDHSTIRLQPLPDGFKTQFVKTAERGQIRAVEGSVRHVEVSWMAV